MFSGVSLEKEERLTLAVSALSVYSPQRKSINKNVLTTHHIGFLRGPGPLHRTLPVVQMFWETSEPHPGPCLRVGGETDLCGQPSSACEWPSAAASLSALPCSSDRKKLQKQERQQPGKRSGCTVGGRPDQLQDPPTP
jgi:hypothetical protein